MKNKVIGIIYIIILIILIIISRNIIKETKDINTETRFEEQIKKIPYYKEENLKRYQNYKKQNKDYSNNEIITNVNIGLDQPFYTNIQPSPRTNTPQVLVNKYNYLEKDYVPKNLELINEKYSNTGMRLVKEARIAFESLAENAAKDGFTITAMSTYRSYSYQESLYNRYKEKDGVELTDTYSARAGHSEHQTGLAIDVYNKKQPYTSFEQTKEFTWMQENAYKYGYILRYPKDKEYITGYQYEPWHYRYVGTEISTYMQKHNITYDEYFIRNLET